jgi:enoyl-CoA hydratase
MSGYDLPEELQVEADGPVRVVRLNRPEKLNATNYLLHKALARVWPQIDADDGARVAVLTGAGRAFSAGGDLPYLAELAEDSALRKETLTDAHQIVTGMIRCRVPIIAAVNGRPSGSAAASWPSRTSLIWRKARTWPTRTCWSASSPPTADRSPGRC